MYSEDLHMQSLALCTVGFNFQKLHIPPTECIMSPIWISQQTVTCPHTPLIGVYNRDVCVYCAEKWTFRM